MSVPVSVEPTNAAKARDVPLDQLIARITQERGSFADLDERQLEKDEEVEPTEDESKSATDAGNDEPTFYEKRAQLSGAVGAALNEAALNLDLVSLLVSGTRLEAGVSTMSPALRAQIAPGSLNAAAVQTPVPGLPNSAGYGWKIMAYDQASVYLEAASKRLRGEVELEQQFWTDMLTTVKSGEVVNRNLQIRYGFRDAGSVYHDKGDGGFVRQHEGHAKLVPNTERLSRRVAVSVFANNTGSTSAIESEDEEEFRLVGRACVEHSDILGPDVLQSVSFERYKLFEEELMHNLIQETRNTLAAKQVRITDTGKLVCTIFGGKIEIEMEDINTTNSMANMSNLNTRDPKNPAFSVCYALHFLQLEAYERRLHQWQSEPKPLNSAGKRASQEMPPLLGPVLARIQCASLLSRTLKLLEIMKLEVVSTENISESNSEYLCGPIRNRIIINCDPQINITLGSTIDSGVAEFKAEKKGVSTAAINDLVELEAWLRWASS